MKTAKALFQKFGQCQFFSKIDLSKGFWQIPVKDEDVHKTAFMTGDVCYEFLKMSFVMKNSGATMVHGIRNLLQGFAHVESYIDDLIIYMKDWDTHLQVLNELHIGCNKRIWRSSRQSACLAQNLSGFWVIWLVAIALPSTKITWRRFVKPNVPPRRRKYDLTWDLSITTIIFHCLRQSRHRRVI